MKAQSVRPDAWLILCDLGSPAWFKEEISALTAGVGEVAWVDGPFVPGASADLVAEILQGYCRENWLITTRVDNDDCVSRHFVRRIQAEFRERREFINFTFGAQHDKGQIYFRLDPSNAFISCVEPAEGGFRSVFVDGHHLLKHHGPVRQVWTAPMWMQVIHGDNIANRTGGIRVSPRWTSDFVHKLPLNDFSGLKGVSLAAKDAFLLFFRVVASEERRAWILASLRRKG